jgi:ribonuclease VapC
VNKPIILDASALLALIFGEKGANHVQEALKRGVYMTTVNLCETMTKMLREGFTYKETTDILEMRIMPIEVDGALAYKAAELDIHTSKYGLSLGDRICVAAAWRWGYTAMTADQSWKNIKLDKTSIQLIR